MVILPAVQIDVFVCESGSASGAVKSLYRQFPSVPGFVHDLNLVRAQYREEPRRNKCRGFPS